MSRLLATTGIAATIATGVALLSPRIGVTHDIAKVVAEVWAVSVLLATGFAAPAGGARRLGWFLGLAALYAVLFSLDVVGLTPALLWFVSLAVLTTGGLVGGYIGSLLEYPGMLMVVAYVAAFADCFSFFHPNGLTANVLTNPKALALLTVPFPILGTEYVASLVGIGDVTFVALFVAGTRATGLSVIRTAIALAVAMLTVSVLVELGGAPLPALPFLGGAVVLVHPEARRLPREHTRRIAANLAVVTLVLGGLLLSAALARRSQAQAIPIDVPSPAEPPPAAPGPTPP
jgi:hypothetical protein